MRTRAFTLIETLLAISLMAVVGAVAYGMLHGGIAARRAVAQGAQESRTLALALDRMARSIEASLPPTGLLAGEFTGEEAADGVNDSLLLHATADPSDANGCDVRRVRFFVELDADEQPCLMVGATANLLSPTEPTEDVQVLCRSIRSLQKIGRASCRERG